MRTENFIAFFTVCGFFIGSIFSIFKAQSPLEMLIYTILITFFFYLIIHVIIINYVDIKSLSFKFFDRHKHEEVADFLVSELAIKEKRMENLILKIASENSQSEKNDYKRKTA